MKLTSLSNFLFLLFFLFSSQSWAKNECKVFSANDILKCLQRNHPEVINDSVVASVSEKLQKQSSALKNPEISIESIGGQNLGSTIIDSEIRISQTFEFSGQKNARRDKSKAEIESFKAESLGKIEDVTLWGVKNLFRLHQIQEELTKVEEAIKQFKSINQVYKLRPKLSPENETTFGMIQIAISQFDIKKNQLSAEKGQIVSELSANTGIDDEIILKNMPARIVKWPDVINLENNQNNSVLKKLKALAEINQSNLALAQAEAWPEFTIDLIAQNKIDGSIQYQAFGAGIKLPLPIFQRNEGEKALRAVDYSRSMNLLNSEKAKQGKIYQKLIKMYQEAIANIANFPSDESIENKHKKSESYFKEGLISGPLIIEVHKQISEYLENKNQEEMRAIESLWKIYILNGSYGSVTI